MRPLAILAAAVCSGLVVATAIAVVEIRREEPETRPTFVAYLDDRYRLPDDDAFAIMRVSSAAEVEARLDDELTVGVVLDPETNEEFSVAQRRRIERLAVRIVLDAEIHADATPPLHEARFAYSRDGCGGGGYMPMNSDAQLRRIFLRLVERSGCLGAPRRS